MKKFKLIQLYPNSPDLGFITNFNEQGEDDFTPNMVSIEDCIKYPEFWEEVKPKKPYATVELRLPESQVALIKRGLDCIVPESSWTEHDIMTLKALTNYHVTISMSVEEYESFTASNGVDFPEYF